MPSRDPRLQQHRIDILSAEIDALLSTQTPHDVVGDDAAHRQLQDDLDALLARPEHKPVD